MFFKKITLVLILVLILIDLSYATCNPSQININHASLEELDKIIWVGPATAQKIIDKRPFEDLDSLIKVSGIGEVKLQAIKDEGLACVEKKDEKNKEPEERLKKNKEKQNSSEIPVSAESVKQEENSVIRLIPKDIKSDGNSERKSKYAIYGFVFFCVLIVFLLVLRKRKINKDEFE